MATRNLWRRVDDPVLAAHPAPEPAALAPVAPAADVPLTPGGNCPDDFDIRMLWHQQAKRNAAARRSQLARGLAQLSGDANRKYGDDVRERVLELFEGERLTRSEIGRLLNIPVSTVYRIVREMQA